MRGVEYTPPVINCVYWEERGTSSQDSGICVYADVSQPQAGANASVIKRSLADLFF